METGNDRFHRRLLSCQHTLDVALESGQIERRRKVLRVEVIDEIEHGSLRSRTKRGRLQPSCPKHLKASALATPRSLIGLVVGSVTAFRRLASALRPKLGS